MLAGGLSAKGAPDRLRGPWVRQSIVEGWVTVLGRRNKGQYRPLSLGLSARGHGREYRHSNLRLRDPDKAVGWTSI